MDGPASEDITRLDNFMVDVVRISTVANFRGSSLTELAFVLTFLKELPSKLKSDFILKVPILSLYQVLNILQPERTLEQLAVMSDDGIRKLCLSQLTFSQIIHASNFAGIDTLQLQKNLWSIFVSRILLNPGSMLPNEISSSLFTHIVKQRCNANDVSQSLLNDILSDTNLTNGQVLNSKGDLCQVIDDLKTMSKINADGKLARCLRKLNQYTPADSGEITELRSHLQKLQDIVQKWSNTKTSDTREFCGKHSCVTRTKRLRVIAQQVSDAVSTCNSTVQSLYEDGLIRKKKTGTSLTWKETFNYWALPNSKKKRI